MLACSLAPAGSAAHETIRMDVARAARAGTCLRIAGSFPTDVAFAPRMGPWRDRSLLAPARRPWRRDSVIVFGTLAVGRSARGHAQDPGADLHSLVLGKSVSVRVDHGGARGITKKKHIR